MYGLITDLWLVIVVYVLTSLFFFQANASKSWLQRNAESMGLILDASDSEEERVQGHKQRKATSAKLQKLQQVWMIKNNYIWGYIAGVFFLVSYH